MSKERRMSAYYYSFESTGDDSIDKILSAVAWAGKLSHHTMEWQDECKTFDDHTGANPIECIQNAANEAAKE